MPARAHAEDWDGEGFTSATCIGVLLVEGGLEADGYPLWRNCTAGWSGITHEDAGAFEPGTTNGWASADQAQAQ